MATFQPFVLYRVVGGNSQRSTMNDYEIIPYLVMKETPRYYYTVQEENPELLALQQKRTTSNSEFFTEITAAQLALMKRLNEALNTVHESWKQVEATSFIGIPRQSRLYIGKFNGKNREKERFFLECRQILRTTNNAWYIETDKTKWKETKRRGTIEVPAGRVYIYQYPSGPHDPAHPFEKWIHTSYDVVISLMRAYYEERVKHLNSLKRKADEWTKQFNEEKFINEQKSHYREPAPRIPTDKQNLSEDS